MFVTNYIKENTRLHSITRLGNTFQFQADSDDIHNLIFCFNLFGKKEPIKLLISLGVLNNLQASNNNIKLSRNEIFPLPSYKPLLNKLRE